MFNKIYNMSCQEGFDLLPDQSIDCIITSPPYAQQREYGGNASIEEEKYPQWTVDWMEKAKRILKPDGSIMINIRPHITDGCVSDYVLKTELAIQNAGWKHNETLTWVKNDGPPLGSLERPRRAYESIFWYSQTNKPYVDLKSNGKFSKHIGFLKSKGVGEWVGGVSDGFTEGVARCQDVIMVPVSTNDRDKNNTHPAQWPEPLASWLLKLCSRKGGVIVDPFMGSGTTAVAAKLHGRQYVGFEINPDYIKIAENRIAKTSELSSDIWDFS